MVSILYLYPPPQSPLIPVSGLKFIIPNGRLADEKKNQREFSVSSNGYTLSANWLFGRKAVFSVLQATRKIRKKLIPKVLIFKILFSLMGTVFLTGLPIVYAEWYFKNQFVNSKKECLCLYKFYLIKKKEKKF